MLKLAWVIAILQAAAGQIPVPANITTQLIDGFPVRYYETVEAYQTAAGVAHEGGPVSTYAFLSIDGGGRYKRWGPTSNDMEADHVHTVIPKPVRYGNMFASHQFSLHADGVYYIGYMGSQVMRRGKPHTGKEVKNWIFSIWDRFHRRVSWRGPNCRRFGGEGTGAHCIKWFNTVEGRLYRFRIVYSKVDGGATYTGTVIDTVTQNETRVGVLFVSNIPGKPFSGYGPFQPGSNMFLEYFGGGICSKVAHIGVGCFGPYFMNRTWGPTSAAPDYKKACKSNLVTGCIPSGGGAGCGGRVYMQGGYGVVRNNSHGHLLWNSKFVSQIVTDSNHIYGVRASLGPRDVYKGSINGGGWHRILPCCVVNIAVQGEYVYGVGPALDVHKGSIDGGAWRKILPSKVTNIVVQDGFVYGRGKDSKVYKGSIDGGDWRMILGCCVKSIAVEGGYVYGTGKKRDVFKGSIHGGHWRKILPCCVTNILVKGGFVYGRSTFGAAGYKAHVVKGSINGSKWLKPFPAQVLANIAVEGGYVYGVPGGPKLWAPYGVVFKAPITGGAWTTFSTSCADTNDIAACLTPNFAGAVEGKDLARPDLVEINVQGNATSLAVVSFLMIASAFGAIIVSIVSKPSKCSPISPGIEPLLK